MKINTEYYMITFSEFKARIDRALPKFQFKCVNYTEKEHMGWSLVLYQAQKDFTAIQYLQSRTWEYHFNGTVGRGLTLEEAMNDHDSKYQLAMREELAMREQAEDQRDRPSL